MENVNFDNTPDKGSGFWNFIFIILLFACIFWFIHLYNSASGQYSDYWEIRIIHSSNGFEVKKYDYDEIMNDALEKAKQIMDENY